MPSPNQDRPALIRVISYPNDDPTQAREAVASATSLLDDGWACLSTFAVKGGLTQAVFVKECEPFKGEAWTPAKERTPSQADADCYGNVWCSLDGRVFQRQWNSFGQEFPRWWDAHWMRTNINKPQPPG